MKLNFGVFLWCIILVLIGWNMLPKVVEIGLIAGLLIGIVNIAESYYNWRKEINLLAREQYEREMFNAESVLYLEKQAYETELDRAERHFNNFKNCDPDFVMSFVEMAKENMNDAEKRVKELEERWNSGKYKKDYYEWYKKAAEENAKKKKRKKMRGY